MAKIAYLFSRPVMHTTRRPPQNRVEIERAKVGFSRQTQARLLAIHIAETTNLTRLWRKT